MVDSFINGTRRNPKQRTRQRRRSIKKDPTVHVLDTNVLVDDPLVFDRYADGVTYVCGVVINELDDFKKPCNHKKDGNKQARKAQTAIGILYKKTKRHNTGPVIQTPHRFVPGKLIKDVSLPKIPCPDKYNVDWNFKSNDHKIVMLCLELRELGKRVELVTKDKNLTIFAESAPIWLKVSRPRCANRPKRS